MKTTQYINDSLATSSVTLENKLSNVTNFLVQKIKPRYFCTHKYYSLTEDPKLPKMVETQKGYKEGDDKDSIFMEFIYIDELPVNSRQSQNNYSVIRDRSKCVIDLFNEEYKKFFNEAFPFKYEKENGIYEEECGYQKYRYHISHIFRFKN
jgi:hypothetical protein